MDFLDAATYYFDLSTSRFVAIIKHTTKIKWQSDALPSRLADTVHNEPTPPYYLIGRYPCVTVKKMTNKDILHCNKLIPDVANFSKEDAVIIACPANFAKEDVAAIAQ